MELYTSKIGWEEGSNFFLSLTNARARFRNPEAMED